MSLRKKMERDDAAERAKQKIYENKIEATVGKQLVHHYPKWKWYVECRLDSGMISVRNVSLHGDYGFYIGIADFINETDPKIVMRAGGEILERFNQQREGRSDRTIIHRDFTGGAVGDISAAN